MPPRRQPRFLVLEGLDGVGTTTQAELLQTALRARDQRVHRTAEPSEGPVGKVARAHVNAELTLDPLTAALTFTADRADHLEREIRPALRDGGWVVCDRYLLSTLAYQGAEGVDRAWILDMSEAFDVPGLTVFLDVGDAVRRERLRARRRSDRYETAELDVPLRASYRESIELLRRRGHRVEVLHADQPPDAVLARILGFLDAGEPTRYT